MTKKYRCIYAVVVFGILCQGCAKKDEPNGVEDTVAEENTTAQTVGADIPDSSIAFIQPGIGVGKVKFGMSFVELKDVLGKPDFDVKGLAHVYSDLGIQVLIRDDKVISVICLQNFPDAPEFKSCKYRTAEGIGIGSTEPDILAAYNEPSSRRSGRLTYKELGLAFGLENDQIQMISTELPR